MIRQIASAIDALAIEGPSRYRWFGEPFDLPEPVRRLAPPDGMRAALVQGIKWRLYADFFTAGAPVPARPPVPPSADDTLARALDAATHGAGSVENGWTFRGVDGERLMVERFGLRLWAEAHEVVLANGQTPRIGDLVSVRMSNAAPRLFPGFHMAFSDVGLDPELPPALDRYYLHVATDVAVECVAQVTDRLNRARLPFRLKILNDPVTFDRCDTAVLSMQRRQRPAALEHVFALAESLGPGLLASVPALTLPLANGLAFAEDAGDGTSFGAQRCGLIASALVKAYELGREGPADRMNLIRQQMATAETTPETPYLGPRTAGDPRADAPPPDHEEVASCR